MELIKTPFGALSPPEVAEVGAIFRLALYSKPPEANLRVEARSSGGWVFYLRVSPEVGGGFRDDLRRFCGGCVWCQIW